MSEVKAIREAVADRGVVGALIDKQGVLFTNIRYPRYQPFQPARVSALYHAVFDRIAHFYRPVGVIVSWYFLKFGSVGSVLEQAFDVSAVRNEEHNEMLEEAGPRLCCPPIRQDG